MLHSSVVMIFSLITILQTSPIPGTQSADSAFITAASDGNATMVAILLNKGANPNAKNSIGSSALMQAAWRGHEEVVRLLLTAGADPNLKRSNYRGRTDVGTTALMLAAVEHQTGVIRILLGYRADATIRDDDGLTALDFAVRGCNAVRRNAPSLGERAARLLSECSETVHLLEEKSLTRTMPAKSPEAKAPAQSGSLDDSPFGIPLDTPLGLVQQWMINATALCTKEDERRSDLYDKLILKRSGQKLTPQEIESLVREDDLMHKKLLLLAKVIEFSGEMYVKLGNDLTESQKRFFNEAGAGARNRYDEELKIDSAYRTLLADAWKRTFGTEMPTIKR